MLNYQGLKNKKFKMFPSLLNLIHLIGICLRLAFSFFFDSKIGQGGFQITYLLCDMALAPADTCGATLSCEDKIFWNAKHSGLVFKADSLTGWILLVPLVQNTDAWAHFQKYDKKKNLVSAWADLRQMYDG